MRGKLFLVLISSLLLIFTVAGTYAGQWEKVSPKNDGFTIMPLTNGDPSGPPLLDPTVPASGPGVAAAVVPEPSTIAMLFLGSGCAGAFTVLRRRRRT
jgi:hypothetical protein